MKQLNHNDISNHKIWQTRYGKYDLSLMLRRLEDIHNAGLTKGGLEDLEVTEAFVRKVFSEFENPSATQHKYGFAFAVPTRITRGSDKYLGEALHFMPVVRRLDANLRQRLISGLPPSVIDEYHRPDGSPSGAVLFVPLYGDMIGDVRNKIKLKFTVKKVIKDTAQFAHRRLGVEIMGLGAMLPKLTAFGAHIRRHGILTTTGHGGTVYLIVKSLEKVRQTLNADPYAPIGFIGGGSIGEASIRLILDLYPQQQVIVHDKRSTHQRELVKRLTARYGQRVFGASSNDDVLRHSSIIISAITSRIKVGEDVDLTNKVIIDDSQPGSFDQEDVQAHGGNVVWVVGHDESEDGFLTRRSEYRFGEEGLLHHGDIWGCEAEVGSLWKTGRIDLAITDEVQPSLAMAIGKEMETVGVEVAAWQQHGALVDLLKGRRST